MVLVSSRVLLHNKLGLHKGRILSKNYMAKLKYVWLSVRVKVSPKQSEGGIGPAPQTLVAVLLRVSFVNNPFQHRPK